MRVTVNQVQQSRIPQSLGLCAGDLPQICSYVNEATQRLINAGGETGWFGGWLKVLFQVSRCDPFITCPREFARVIQLAPCGRGVKIQNQFYEMMEAGIGLQEYRNCKNWCGAMAGYERNSVPTMVELTPANQLLQVMVTDPRDVGSRILIAGNDQNGNPIYSQDGENSVLGFYITLASPFATSGFIVSSIASIQKDATYGDLLLYQVDSTTGVQVLLSRFAPDEINPSYRRYYINKLPCGCFCHTAQSPCIQPVTPNTTVPVSAMVKLEFIPVNRATDFLIIGNIPALKEECLSIRYGEMDAPNVPGMAAQHHARAIKLLQDELRHYEGDQQISMNFAPFGTARLSRVMRAVRNG